MSKPGRVAKVAGNVGCAFCFLLLLHAPYAPLALAASPARGTDAVMPGPKAGIVAVAGVRPPCVSRCADGISLSCGCLSLRAEHPDYSDSVVLERMCEGPPKAWLSALDFPTLLLHSAFKVKRVQKIS